MQQVKRKLAMMAAGILGLTAFVGIASAEVGITPDQESALRELSFAYSDPPPLELPEFDDAKHILIVLEMSDGQEISVSQTDINGSFSEQSGGKDCYNNPPVCFAGPARAVGAIIVDTWVFLWCVLTEATIHNGCELPS